MNGIFTTVYDALNNTEVTLCNSIFKLILSMVLGMLVGAERKRKGQIAGVRTFALISMGACMAMLLSIYVPQVYLGLKNGDPGRIAAQVITGVGFLGGGAMIHMKGSVRGLTTAAGIWMTATIGMAVGVGMYICSIVATALILATLILFEAYEHHRNLAQENRALRIKVTGIIDDIEPYKETLTRHNVHLSTFFIDYNYETDTTDINFIIMTPANRNYIALFQEMRAIAPTKSLTLTSQA